MPQRSQTGSSRASGLGAVQSPPTPPPLPAKGPPARRPASPLRWQRRVGAANVRDGLRPGPTVCLTARSGPDRPGPDRPALRPGLGRPWQAVGPVLTRRRESGG